MIKILFVCHGNICRSPMAEFVMKDLVEREGLSHEFEIASAATSTEELGNPVYPPARKKLAEHGLSCEGKYARQLRRDDRDYDYIVGMDQWNMRNISRMIGADYDGKIVKLLTYAGRDDDVADPWYTGDFETTYRDVVEGCSAMLEELKKEL